MPQGEVKFYKAEMGFGFIKPDGGGADLYVSKYEAAKVEGELKAGQRVEFDLKTHPVIECMVATRIEIVDKEKPAERFRTTALADMEWPDNAGLPR